MPESEESRLQRRGFIRQGMARLVSPLVDRLSRPAPPPPVRTLLRPPGARPEPDFLDTCFRCSNCADACPANAIRPYSGNGTLGGTPFIDANLAACVVCDGLVCTTVCASGALSQLTRPQEIRIGLAEVSPERCLRTDGEACTHCVDRCPLGREALVVTGQGPPTVIEAGCVGCGVCQLYCPTDPKAIVVNPLQ